MNCVNHEMKYKVSIIIPVYNVAEYLQEAVESATNQTLVEVEVIAIDDGSIDGSYDLLTNLSEKYDNLYVYHQENHGLGYTRNKGIEYSRGEYLIFLDADDWVRKDTSFICYNLMSENNLDVLLYDAECVGNVENSGKKGAYDRSKLKIDEKCLSGYEMLYQLYSKGSFVPAAPLAVVSRQYVVDCGINFVPNLYWEDNLYHVQIMKQAKRVMHISDKMYFRRIREESITTSVISRKHVVDCAQIALDIFDEASSEKELLYWIAADVLASSFKKCLGYKGIQKDYDTIRKLEYALDYFMMQYVPPKTGYELAYVFYKVFTECVFDVKAELKIKMRNYIKKAVKIYMDFCHINLQETTQIGWYGTGERATKVLEMLEFVYGNIMKQIKFYDTRKESMKYKFKDAWIYNIAEIGSCNIDVLFIASKRYSYEMKIEAKKYLNENKLIMICDL